MCICVTYCAIHFSLYQHYSCSLLLHNASYSPVTLLPSFCLLSSSHTTSHFFCFTPLCISFSFHRSSSVIFTFIITFFLINFFSSSFYHQFFIIITFLLISRQLPFFLSTRYNPSASPHSLPSNHLQGMCGSEN